jgi:hypothetical protein
MPCARLRSSSTAASASLPIASSWLANPLVLGAFLEHPQPDHDRHQPLLGAVMKIALEPTALVIAGLDDPQARCAQLVEQAVCSRPASARSPLGRRWHGSRYRALDGGSERQPDRRRL